MKIAVVGGSGPTGRHVLTQAVAAGHHVTVLARDPAKLTDVDPGVQVLPADVLDLASVERALAGQEAVVSALGITKGDRADTLSTGASHIITAMRHNSINRLAFMSALGSGRSLGQGGRLYQVIINRMLGDEVAEKGRAEEIVLAGAVGVTVAHPGPLTNGPSTDYRAVPAEQFRAPLLPPRISRATVARFLLASASAETPPGSSASLVLLTR